ncbi:hypothetical protein [Candidatus Uabimicrobium sp. HlEnr_7]|uniref:hypothetical protein n=1 Tax=Candidatus Uabimicrobium helgolandensis TaxID=3095367 RepID=UPI003558F8FB
MKIKGKSLKKIESNTSYYGCTFYLDEKKWYKMADSVFNNCSFRSSVGFQGLKNCNFINCNFSGELRLKITSFANSEYVEAFTKLTSLDLGYRWMRNEELLHLKSLTNLHSLNLQQTLITDEGLQHLTSLTNLTSLNLQDTEISDEGLKHLKSLSNLTFLNLKGTKISDEGLQHLKSLTNLTSLNLLCTEISNKGLKHLKSLSNLTSLHVTEMNYVIGTSNKRRRIRVPKTINLKLE